MAPNTPAGGRQPGVRIHPPCSLYEGTVAPIMGADFSESARIRSYKGCRNEPATRTRRRGQELLPRTHPELSRRWRNVVADSRVQIEVEGWVRRVWMECRFGVMFEKGCLRLAPGGEFEFGAASPGGKVVAVISTSTALTTGGKPGIGHDGPVPAIP